VLAGDLEVVIEDEIALPVLELSLSGIGPGSG
jgi:hypothetical protein